MNEHADIGGECGRRNFFARIGAGIISVVLGLAPLGAGLLILFDPLRRKRAAPGLVRIASLDDLPNDGTPRKFKVISTLVDAWNKFPQTPVGAVYLRRTEDGKVQAFNVVCPHAGCFVDFLPQKGVYLCPCHNSTFTVTGAISDPSSPAARGLDSLEVEVRNQTEVWVKFQNFQAGRPEKIPAA